MVEPLSGVRPARLRRPQAFSSSRFGRALNGLGPLGWHALYFFVLCLIASVMLYGVGQRAAAAGTSQGQQYGARMGYLDAVFLGVTSITGAGLSNVSLSSLPFFSLFFSFFFLFFPFFRGFQ